MFLQLQSLHGPIRTTRIQLFAQGIAELAEAGEILTMAALQPFQQGQSILQDMEPIRIALQGSAISLQIPDQISHGGLKIEATLRQGLQGAIQGHHLLQFMATGHQVIHGRRGLIRSVLKATHQFSQSLLQANAVHQPILLSREHLNLQRILQGGSLQFRQQLLARR
jgi:hypothetical protein